MVMHYSQNDWVNTYNFFGHRNAYVRICTACNHCDDETGTKERQT